MKGLATSALFVAFFGFAAGASAQTGSPAPASTMKPAASPMASATTKPAATPAATPKADNGTMGGSTASGDVKVEAKACKSVANRECQDEGTSFDATTGSVSCWTRVTGLENGGTIHHVWFKGDESMGDVELKIGGSPWRTYSKKTVSGDMKGDWRVEVRDGSGAVLETVKFTVQ
jgi:hypothetical protein